jgi:hypothetical protein
VKLSAQFLATLNQGGRTDPLESASVIGLAISTALCSLRNLDNIGAANIEFVEFHASLLAKGPCASSAKIGGQRFPIAEAPRLPLIDCAHPGQCACMYQARLSLAGEF